MKNSITNIRLTLAATTVALFMPMAAHASYEGCVARTWDHIGCWLSEKLGGDYIAPGGPVEGGGEDFDRAEAMLKDGSLKLEGIDGEAHDGKRDGKYVQVCETGKMLDMVEAGVGAAELSKTCYKPAK